MGEPLHGGIHPWDKRDLAILMQVSTERFFDEDVLWLAMDWDSEAAVGWAPLDAVWWELDEVIGW